MSDTRTPYVYRLFGAEGVLLYIGSSINPRARWERHAREQPWWAEVESVKLADYPSLPDAREAEKLAIRDESPRYSVMRYSQPVGSLDRRGIRLDDKDWHELGEIAEALDRDRGWIIRKIVAWYLERPGAELL